MVDKVAKRVVRQSAPVEVPPEEPKTVDESKEDDAARAAVIKKNREDTERLLNGMMDLAFGYGNVKALSDAVRVVVDASEPGLPDPRIIGASNDLSVLFGVNVRKFRKAKRAIKGNLVDLRRSFVVKMVSTAVETMSDAVDEIEAAFDD